MSHSVYNQFGERKGRKEREAPLRTHSSFQKLPELFSNCLTVQHITSVSLLHIFVCCLIASVGMKVGGKRKLVVPSEMGSVKLAVNVYCRYAVVLIIHNKVTL